MDELERLADLGEELRPTEVPWERLRARTMAAIAGPTPVRPHRVRPALVAATVAGMAAATAGAVLITGGAGTPSTPEVAHGSDGTGSSARPAAFKLTRNADGSVTFTVNDLLNLDGATQALNNAGIAGRVLTSTADCTTGPNAVPIDPANLYRPDTVHRKDTDMTGGETVVVRSSDYPPGGGLLIGVAGEVRRPETALHLLVVAYAYIDANKIPTCVNFVDPGTGGFPAWPPTARHPN